MTCDASARHVAAAVQASGGSDAAVSWENRTATFVAGDAVLRSRLNH